MDKAEISPKKTFRTPVCTTLTNKEATYSSEFRLALNFLGSFSTGIKARNGT